MSVLIKGMELPPLGCTKTITICSDGIVFEDFDSSNPFAKSSNVYTAEETETENS